MPDREKTLKEFDRITSVLVDALILLQDQPDVVFCKDCKHGNRLDNQIECVCEYSNSPKGFHDGNWFCADGERMGKKM
jgi:hypothetical protein